jgi:hypothetical protein
MMMKVHLRKPEIFLFIFVKYLERRTLSRLWRQSARSLRGTSHKWEAENLCFNFFPYALFPALHT